MRGVLDPLADEEADGNEHGCENVDCDVKGHKGYEFFDIIGVDICPD